MNIRFAYYLSMFVASMTILPVRASSAAPEREEKFSVAEIEMATTLYSDCEPIVAETAVRHANETLAAFMDHDVRRAFNQHFHLVAPHRESRLMVLEHFFKLVPARIIKALPAKSLESLNSMPFAMVFGAQFVAKNTICLPEEEFAEHLRRVGRFALQEYLNSEDLAHRYDLIKWKARLYGLERLECWLKNHPNHYKTQENREHAARKLAQSIQSFKSYINTLEVRSRSPQGS